MAALPDSADEGRQAANIRNVLNSAFYKSRVTHFNQKSKRRYCSKNTAQLCFLKSSLFQNLLSDFVYIQKLPTLNYYFWYDSFARLLSNGILSKFSRSNFLLALWEVCSLTTSGNSAFQSRLTSLKVMFFSFYI